jgi:hypothetical protein
MTPRPASPHRVSAPSDERQAQSESFPRWSYGVGGVGAALAHGLFVAGRRVMGGLAFKFGVQRGTEEDGEAIARATAA